MPDIRFPEQVRDLSDLCRLLGGSPNSFTSILLELIEKARATHEHLERIRIAFPREVRAWEVWQHTDDRYLTGVELLAMLDTARCRYCMTPAAPDGDGLVPEHPAGPRDNPIMDPIPVSPGTRCPGSWCEPVTYATDPTPWRTLQQAHRG